MLEMQGKRKDDMIFMERNHLFRIYNQKKF